jgi:hypothetical protein
LLSGRRRRVHLVCRWKVIASSPSNVDAANCHDETRWDKVPYLTLSTPDIPE